MSFKTSEFHVLAEGLGYPEGPVYQSDGNVLLVEIRNSTLTRIAPNGTKQIVATLWRRSQRCRLRPRWRHLRVQ